jgi:hypothetical protein
LSTQGSDLAAVSPSETARLLTMAVGAGLLAGLLSWLVGEVLVEAFRPKLDPQTVMGYTFMKASFEDQAAADYKNAVLAFAVLGSLLAGTLGIAGGLSSRSTRRAVRAGAAGLVLGGFLGAVSSLAILPVYYRALDQNKEELSRDLILPLMVHVGIWAACGVAGGVGLGVGLGGKSDLVMKAALGGLIGAALGACLYEIIGAAAFAADKTTSPLSVTWSTRLLARLLVTIMAATIAAVVVNTPTARKTSSTMTP